MITGSDFHKTLKYKELKYFLISWKMTNFHRISFIVCVPQVTLHMLCAFPNMCIRGCPAGFA